MSESIKIGGFGAKPNQLATLSSGENVYSISTPGKVQYVIGEQQGNSINVFSIATLNVLKPSQLHIPNDKVDIVSKLQVLAEYVFKSYVVERRYASRLWKMLDDHAARQRLPVFIEDTSKYGWTEVYLSRHHSDAVFLGVNDRQNKTWIYRP